jgi:hypothetical protein
MKLLQLPTQSVIENSHDKIAQRKSLRRGHRDCAVSTPLYSIYLWPSLYSNAFISFVILIVHYMPTDVEGLLQEAP